MALVNPEQRALRLQQLPLQLPQAAGEAAAQRPPSAGVADAQQPRLQQPQNEAMVPAAPVFSPVSPSLTGNLSAGGLAQSNAGVLLRPDPIRSPEVAPQKRRAVSAPRQRMDQEDLAAGLTGNDEDDVIHIIEDEIPGRSSSLPRWLSAPHDH